MNKMNKMNIKAEIQNFDFKNLLDFGVIILIGLPGSGKTTLAKKIALQSDRFAYISSDEYRSIIGKSESDQSVTKEVFEKIKRDCEYFLKVGKTVIFDATNVKKKDRAFYINLTKKHNQKVCALYLDTPVWESIRRNVNRHALGGRLVPQDVIDRMNFQMERPNFQEGFDWIILIPECRYHEI